jgi:hypothetical protein
VLSAAGPGGRESGRGGRAMAANDSEKRIKTNEEPHEAQQVDKVV